MAGRIPNWIGRLVLSWKLYHPMHTHAPPRMSNGHRLKEGRPARDAKPFSSARMAPHLLMAYPTPLRDAQGRIVGGINMLLDITERKRAEAATASLAAIVNSSDDAIISEDLNGVSPVERKRRASLRLHGAGSYRQPITLLTSPDRPPGTAWNSRADQAR